MVCRLLHTLRERDMGIGFWVIRQEKERCHGKKGFVDDRHLSFLNEALMSEFHDCGDGLFELFESLKAKDEVAKMDSHGRGGGEEKEEEEEEEEVVCVTSAASYLGLAIVKQLLALGYSVRALVDEQDDIERLREMGINEQAGEEKKMVEMRWVSLTDDDNGDVERRLYDAFNGCRGVFHTSSFIDHSGLSGYSKSMAELEVRATTNVMRACSRAPSVAKCVLTSSLLCCIWQDDALDESSTRVIDHDSWSQDSTCIDKKLWFALGKLRAEKEAWRIAQESHLRLATLCPALITGPDYYQKNPTPTIAYLKGCPEMYAKGVLATIDVRKLARAHVYVYKAMNDDEFGRYICFDRVIRSEAEAEKLSLDTGVAINGDETMNSSIQYQLSNAWMNQILLSRSNRCHRNCH